eukprot:GHVL01009402.1.p1 GENE.GHVL01009402.1~~GHVL01009402.1.p1  ORF type:complete len:515 (+),score=93.56 GHVL01009402.1:24-1568(+)
MNKNYNYIAAVIASSVTAVILILKIRNKKEKKINANYDVIIVGAGLTGCIMSLKLAEMGRSVMVIEKDLTEQDRIVGEYMQPAGIAALDRLGLGDVLKNVGGVDSFGYFLSSEKKNVFISYPPICPINFLQKWGNYSSKNDGNIKGIAFHNNKLIQALREKVFSKKCIKIIQGNVINLKSENNIVSGVQYNMNQSMIDATAPLTILCDGGQSFGKIKSLSSKKISTWAGVILDHPENCPPVLKPKHGHIYMINPEPVLIYQISSNETRLLVCTDGNQSDIQKYIRNCVLPELPDITTEAVEKSLNNNKIIFKNSYQLPAHLPSKRGMLVVGDSLNQRHPLTGAGMTVCIKDAELLSKCLVGVDVYNWKEVNRSFKRFLSIRKPYAASLNILADALHQVFSIPPNIGTDHQRIREILRLSCLEYLGQGGAKSLGPMGLVGGLTDSPSILLCHFFAVVFNCFSNLKTSNPLIMYKILHEGCKILIPLLIREKVTVLSYWPLHRIIHLIFPFQIIKY